MMHSKILKSSTGETPKVSGVTSKPWRPTSFASGLMQRGPRHFVVTRTWCWVLDCNTIHLATVTKSMEGLWDTSQYKTLFGLGDTVVEVCTSCKGRLCASIASRCEYRRTSFHFRNKILRWEPSINKIQREVSFASCIATHNRIQILRLLGQKWGRIVLSTGSGCLFAVRGCETYLALVRLVHLWSCFWQEDKIFGSSNAENNDW